MSGGSSGDCKPCGSGQKIIEHTKFRSISWLKFRNFERDAAPKHREDDDRMEGENKSKP